MRRWARGGGVLLVAALLAGCGGAAGDQPRPFATYERELPDDDSYVFHPAGLSGRLLLLDGCLYVSAPERWLPVFPHDTEWDADAQTLTFEPGPGSGRIGEVVTLGGAALSSFDPDRHRLPPECEVPEYGPGSVRVWLVELLGDPF